MPKRRVSRWQGTSAIYRQRRPLSRGWSEWVQALVLEVPLQRQGEAPRAGQLYGAGLEEGARDAEAGPRSARRRAHGSTKRRRSSPAEATRQADQRRDCRDDVRRNRPRAAHGKTQRMEREIRGTLDRAHGEGLVPVDWRPANLGDHGAFAAPDAAPHRRPWRARNCAHAPSDGWTGVSLRSCNGPL